MTILFYNKLKYNVLTSILGCATTSSGDASSGVNTYWGAFAVTVWSGVQPSAATINSNWTSYNSTFLCHWQGVQLNMYNAATGTLPAQISLVSPSSYTTALNSGTAAWGILWPSNPTQASVTGSSIPSSRFVVCSASLPGGGGPIIFTDTAITASSSVQILDVTITASGGSN